MESRRNRDPHHRDTYHCQQGEGFVLSNSCYRPKPSFPNQNHGEFKGRSFKPYHRQRPFDFNHRESYQECAPYRDEFDYRLNFSQPYSPLTSEDHVMISKELVRMLRHGKYHLLRMSEDGFINVHEIVRDRKFCEACGYRTANDIVEIVSRNDKQRFKLRNDGWDLEIAATQGHTIEIKNTNLQPLRDPGLFPHVLHGTYYEAWEEIQETGLNRMKRNHIHFASGLPRDGQVISGMRYNVEVVIELDLPKAMKDGLNFFVSSNGVILCEGDHLGRIHPKFFKDVYAISRGQVKLVICATLKKLTVTLLGLRSLPSICSANLKPTFVCVKLSLIPDQEHRVPFKSAPVIVNELSASLHQTFSFSLNKRSMNKRLLVSAWIQPKDNGDEKPTFIGCMSFGIRKVLSCHEVTQGWFYFLSASLGRRKHLSCKVRGNYYETANRLSRDGFTKQLEVRTTNKFKDDRKKVAANPRHKFHEFNAKVNKKNLKSADIFQKNPESIRNVDNDPLTTKRRVSFLEAVLNKENVEELGFSKLSIAQTRSQANKLKSPMRHGYDLRRKQLSSKHPRLLRAVQISNQRQKLQNGLRISTKKPTVDPNSDMVKAEETKRKSTSFQKYPCYSQLNSKNFTIKEAKIIAQPLLRTAAFSDMNSAIPNEDKVMTKPCHEISADIFMARRKKLKILTESEEKGTSGTGSTGNIAENVKKNRLPLECIQTVNFSSPRCKNITKQADHLQLKTCLSSQTSLQDSSPILIAKTAALDIIHKPVSSIDLQLHPNDVGKKSHTSVTKVCTQTLPHKSESSSTSSDDEPLKHPPFQSLTKYKEKSCSESNGNLKASSKSRTNFLKSLFSKKESSKVEKNDESRQKHKNSTCIRCQFAEASFSQVLNSKDGIIALRSFLVKEYSEENLDFWLECQVLGHEKSKNRHEMASKIYSRFLTPESSKEINIDAAVRKQAQEKLRKGWDNPFAEACDEVLKLLEKDCFPRFQKSKCLTCDC